VVPVESAHTPGALSEITVPASHTRVHHHPEAIGELQRILCAHLREFGGVGPDGGVREAAFLPGQP
jgi:hypothetical protein